LKKIE